MTMNEEDKERLKICLEIALDNRKLEIELLWKRTLIFWGFVAALFVAVANVVGRKPDLAAALSVIGVIFSLIWTLANRGAKSWQESWELKSNDFLTRLHEKDENVFRRRTGPQDDVFVLLRPAKYSVSKLLVALSDFVLVFWIGLTLYQLPIGVADLYMAAVKQHAIILFAIFGSLYLPYIFIACRSRPDETPGPTA